MVATAFERCLEDAGISVRQAARILRCSKNTVERMKLNGVDLLPLRSQKLALCFAKNLHLLVEARSGEKR